ncbi:PA2169 family four-helix-bundle protein [Tahibacter harae]|uniref:PA2169 family four-helix-bundle protein n=1 Tax=Tahibacter harae TaxID=2963937 RepID=A0ABT1QXT2_9GAMM|nr:PA2169 family four-helix-bundle protein [Tahibacter harae]MCQ4167088.1 PA2169 family four-helix-bundle protein [Tahibacter harae]
MSTSSNLKDLIELLNDGEKFYAEAAAKVKIPAYANLFQRMAQQKQAIASDLSARLSALGESAPQGGTMLGSLRKFYTDVRASMSKDSEAVYVGQLEQTEDRILEAFRDELTQSEDLELRRIAERHYPDLKRTHDEMRDLKRRLAA